MRVRWFAVVPALSLFTLAAPAFGTGGWHVVSSPAGANAGLTATSFAASTDGWAVGVSQGDPLAEHWNGSAWRTVRTPAFDNSAEALTGVATAGANDAWAVGWHDPYGTTRVHGLTLHWNGTRWSVARDKVGSKIPVAVAARTATDVWAVGNDLFDHFDGTGWTSFPGPQPSGLHLRSVIILAADDAWAAGGRDDPRPGYHHDVPYLAHWDGTSWSQVTTPYDTMTGDYSALTATSASDVWAVGTDDGPEPISVHFDGTSWQAVPIPGRGTWARVSGVVAVSPTDAWAVGDQNGALPDGFAVLRTLTEHWDGTRWSIVGSRNDSDSDNYLTAAAASGGNVWAVGADGGTLIEQR